MAIPRRQSGDQPIHSILGIRVGRVHAAPLLPQQRGSVVCTPRSAQRDGTVLMPFGLRVAASHVRAWARAAPLPLSRSSHLYLVAARFLATPTRAVLGLIVLTALLRLALAGLLGLGIDESYMVAAGRQFELGYVDHPPLSWWLTWSAVHLLGSESGVVVRIPFIALFGLSTWLMYRLGAVLFSAEAGLWAALAFNLAPVFGVSTATFVLPDGPLDCALLGFALCLVYAMSSARRGWWLAAGACGGMALLSKYTALLTLAGAGFYLLTHERWRMRVEPYVAALVAALLFTPVLIWNASNEWVSFAFQGSRALGVQFKPLALLSTLIAQSIYLLPWIWLPLMMAFAAALRRGPGDKPSWFLCCLGAPPIIAFSLISIWSRSRVLPHWAAPGYLMLFPLLGCAVAERIGRGDRRPLRWFVGTTAFVGIALAVLVSEVRWNWLPTLGEDRVLRNDPDLDLVDWTSLRNQLAQRNLLGPSAPPIAAVRWIDAGKLDYALGGLSEVICLCKDAHQYAITDPAARHGGEDVLIVAPRTTVEEIHAELGAAFASIDQLPPLVLLHAGQEALTVPLFLGHGLIWHEAHDGDAPSAEPEGPSKSPR